MKICYYNDFADVDSPCLPSSRCGFPKLKTNMSHFSDSSRKMFPLEPRSVSISGPAQIDLRKENNGTALGTPAAFAKDLHKIL